MGWTLHMIMCVLLCYPVSIHMSHLLSTGHPISSFKILLCKIIGAIWQSAAHVSTLGQVNTVEEC